MTDTQKPQTIGQKLTNLEDTLVLQFKNATTDQAVQLSANIHKLVKQVAKIARKHDTICDMIASGEIPFKVKPTVERIRKARTETVKPANELADLDF